MRGAVNKVVDSVGSGFRLLEQRLVGRKMRINSELNSPSRVCAARSRCDFSHNVGVGVQLRIEV